MIRPFKESDIFMPLAEGCRREKEAVTMVSYTDSQFLRELWKNSDVAMTFCNKKGNPQVVWGYTNDGYFWLMFSEAKEIPFSFFRGLARSIDTAVERYGKVMTDCLMDTLEDEYFHKKIYKVGKWECIREYEENGHKWAEYGRRWKPCIMTGN